MTVLWALEDSIWILTGLEDIIRDSKVGGPTNQLQPLSRLELL